MKKNFSLIYVLLVLIIFGSFSCNQEAGKYDSYTSTKERQLQDANDEFSLEVKKFRSQMADRFEANKRTVTEFVIYIESESEDIKTNYKKQLGLIIQQNFELEKKIDDYCLDGKENFDIFRLEFIKEMNQMGKALSDITVREQ